MQEILTVNVSIDDAAEVNGGGCSVCMVAFSGTADGPYFHGKILPHGVDTQRRAAGQPMTLSARYILEGTDDQSTPCRIFIENNGTEDSDHILRTRPAIVTDSSSLAWMEQADLHGTVEGTEGGVIIHIFADISRKE